MRAKARAIGRPYCDGHNCGLHWQPVRIVDGPSAPPFIATEAASSASHRLLGLPQSGARRHKPGRSKHARDHTIAPLGRETHMRKNLLLAAVMLLTGTLGLVLL